MNKKLIAISLSSLLIFSTQSLASQIGLYLKKQEGVSLNKVGTHTYHDNISRNFEIKYNSKNKWGFTDTTAIGYDFSTRFDIPIRVELDYTYRSNIKYQANGHAIEYTYDGKVTDPEASLHSKTRMNTLLFNTYFDIKTDSFFTPYASLGIGTAFTKYELSNNVYNHHHSKSKFAWSVGGGLGIDVTPSLKLDLSARYVNAGNIHHTNTQYATATVSSIKSNLSAIDVLMGLRYTF